ncbi:MAG: hypothetical protein BAJALOKI1v1_1740003 [Promethearchaeota archaeon]|nr:MAG: hypothetical protein BAJALOKI1v1_1740003 [Candidatus Lokiarchaeota archaeon]
MTSVNESDNKKGLLIGSKIPLDEFREVFGETIRVSDLLTNYDGILIDFFRGAF